MTYVTVKYGVNQEVIANSNCLTPMLLDYLKKASGMEAQLAAKEALDLASETGEIVDLLSKSKQECAKKYLEARGTYLLLKVYTENEDATPVYTPLTEVNEKVRNALNNPKKRRVVESASEFASAASSMLSALDVKKNARKPPATPDVSDLGRKSVAEKPVKTKK